jgi:hypothetical protein
MCGATRNKATPNGGGFYIDYKWSVTQAFLVMCQISPMEERIKETDIGSKTFNVGLDDVVIVTDTTSFVTSVSHSDRHSSFAHV